MDLENIDTIKAFGTLFLGAVVAAMLFYVYQGSVRPKVLQLVGTSKPSGVAALPAAA